MSKLDFTNEVVEHVLERLLYEIDRGEPSFILYSTWNNDGTSHTEKREINIKHRIESAVAQKLIDDSGYMEKLRQKIDTMLDSSGFIEKVVAGYATQLISWLQEKDNWDNKYKNKESFDKGVRTQVVKIIAQRKADELIASKGQS